MRFAIFRRITRGNSKGRKIYIMTKNRSGGAVAAFGDFQSAMIFPSEIEAKNWVEDRRIEARQFGNYRFLSDVEVEEIL